MTRKKDDGLPPTTFLKTPEQIIGIDITEFVDIDTGQMLLKGEGGLVGLDGKPISRPSGMKLNEAMSHAAQWWDRKARFAMPDRPKVKGDEYLSKYGVASGVLLGYPWENLAKEEKLQVLKAWWFNVGVPQFVHGLDTKSDGNKGVIH